MALAWLAGVHADDRVIEQLDIAQPRTFGYHIGDKFSRTVTLQLRHPYLLATKTLPAAGRLTEWLALETPRVTVENLAAATRYELRLTYQVVNIGAEPAAIAVPHHDLTYSDGKETLKALIPATRVSVSPLRSNSDSELQPALRPAPLRFDDTAMSLGGATLLLSLLTLGYLHGGFPSRRRARPFVQAQRAIEAARRRGWRDADYELALRAVHRACNETAGRTVFADTLDGFLLQCAPYAALRAPLAEFYARSRSHFFAATSDAPVARYTAQELNALVRKCRAIERGLA